MPHKTLALLALAVPALSQTLTLDFNQGIYHSGDSVTATVTASTAFGFDTDLGVSSSSIPAGVTMPVTLGPVPGPGIYQVRFYTDADPNAYLALLIFAPDAQGNLQLYAGNVTGKATPVVVNKTLLKTFWDAALQNGIAKDAFLTAANNFVTQHPEVLALSAAMALTPGFEAGAVVEAGGAWLSVMQDFLQKVVDEELQNGLISPTDVETLRGWFAKSDGVLQVVQIAISGGAAEVGNFFHAVNAALDFSQQTEANTTVHGAIGFIDEKVEILLEIFKTGGGGGENRMLAPATVAGLAVKKDNSASLFRAPFAVDPNGAPRLRQVIDVTPAARVRK